MRADLNGCLANNQSLNGLPFTAILGEGIHKAGMLLLGPVLTALGEDVLLARSLLAGQGGDGLGRSVGGDKGLLLL